MERRGGDRSSPLSYGLWAMGLAKKNGYRSDFQGI